MQRGARSVRRCASRLHSLRERDIGLLHATHGLAGFANAFGLTPPELGKIRYNACNGCDLDGKPSGLLAQAHHGAPAGFRRFG